ncbi:MAG: Rod shape-determining protein RodA, partial [Candidatus Levybacteria bacterium GW2011_GWA1_39_32]
LMVYAKPFYLISIFLLLILFILGSEVRGAVRWIEVFGFQAQFSEILKPFLAVSFAFLLSDLRNYSYKNFLIIFLLLFPLFLLIFLQPDLGNSLIYFGTVLFVLLIYGFPFKYMIIKKKEF